jgi:hypothetical protein
MAGSLLVLAVSCLDVEGQARIDAAGRGGKRERAHRGARASGRLA